MVFFMPLCLYALGYLGTEVQTTWAKKHCPLYRAFMSSLKKFPVYGEEHS